MTAPVIVATSTPQLGDGITGETLVLGPSLGTTTAVWDQAAGALSFPHPLLSWDLPGHGSSPAVTVGTSFTMTELAEGVLRAVDAAGVDRFSYAGVSLGGVVGLQLALLAPERVRRLAMVCSLPQIGTSEGWAQRAADTRAMGTPSLVAASARRWFALGFLDRQPDVGSRLLSQLLDIDDESYAQCVEALADTDLRDALPGLSVPLTLIEGEADSVIPLDDARAAADAAPDAVLHVLAGVAHLAPVEDPDSVAALLLKGPR